jgi:UDP-2,3-diacylglucosamine hydrolase
MQNTETQPVSATFANAAAIAVSSQRPTPHIVPRTCSTLPAGTRKVGILAGWGRYPVVIAEALREQGYEVFVLGVKGHADPALADLSHHFGWVGLAKIGGAVRFFRRHGVHHVTMAGKIHKFLLFQPWAWFKHLPDWRAIRTFYPHFATTKKDRRDDTLLNAVIDTFADDGITFAPATDFLPELLVNLGQLTKRGPTKQEATDIEFGWTMAKELGRLDIGQSVTIKGRAALAVEAIEGTDACIRRAGQLCAPGFTVVKVAKPKQDMRFDVPTIGLGTLESMVEAGASCLAVEAGRTIIIDQPEVIRYADRHRLAIVAVNDGQVPEPAENHT